MAATKLVASGADTDTYYEACQQKDGAGKDCLWVVNGAAHPAGNWKIYWTGSAYTAVKIGAGAAAPPPAFKFIKSWLGRLWGFGNSDHRKTVYYSGTDADIEEFPSTDPCQQIEIVSPGGNIASGEVWERDMFVFLEHNIVCIPYALVKEDYRQVNLGAGWGNVAPYSLRRCGSHGLVCVSDSGVREFPSGRILSGAIDRTFQDLDLEFKRASYGKYNPVDDTYNLLTCSGATYGGGGVTFTGHDQRWVWDFKRNLWYKKPFEPWSGIMDVFNYKHGRRLLMGTYKGRTYRHDYRESAGTTASYTGTVDSATTNTLTDADGGFPTAGNGLHQVPVYIVSGTGAGSYGIISENTGTQLTVETLWDTQPVAGDIYIVGAIRGRIGGSAVEDILWLNMGDPQRNKRFYELRIAVNKDVIGRYYILKLYRDYDNTPIKTIKGKFTKVDTPIILNAAAKALGFQFDIFGQYTGLLKRPEIKSMVLAWQLQRY